MNQEFWFDLAGWACIVVVLAAVLLLFVFAVGRAFTKGGGHE